MRYLREAAVGTALVASLAACTSGQSPEGGPTIPYVTTTNPAPEAPASPAQPAPAFELNPAATNLFDHDAGVNLIYLRPETVAQASLFGHAKTEAKIRREIISADPKFLASIREGFARITYGRYKPRSVTVTIASGKVAVGCLSDADSELGGQGNRLEAAAAPFDRPDELNVIVFDQQTCDDNPEAVAGFELTDGTEDPILDAASFTEFNDVIEHESGHDGGLNHAGLADCKDPVAIKDCKLDPVGDPLSVMSYVYEPGLSSEPEHYSYPELGILGLLKPDEILDEPTSGEYKLTPMGETGLKVIKLIGDNFRPVYLSFEADPSAAYDTECVSDPNYGEKSDPLTSNPNVLYIEGGKRSNFTCLKVHPRKLKSSLQVRTPENATKKDSAYGAQEFLADVTRKPRAANPFDPPTISGEVDAPTTIYESSSYAVTLVKISSGAATIKVVDKATPSPGY